MIQSTAFGLADMSEWRHKQMTLSLSEVPAQAGLQRQHIATPVHGNASCAVAHSNIAPPSCVLVRTSGKDTTTEITDVVLPV